MRDTPRKPEDAWPTASAMTTTSSSRSGRPSSVARSDGAKAIVTMTAGQLKGKQTRGAACCASSTAAHRSPLPWLLGCSPHLPRLRPRWLLPKARAHCAPRVRRRARSSRHRRATQHHGLRAGRSQGDGCDACPLDASGEQQQRVFGRLLESRDSLGRAIALRGIGKCPLHAVPTRARQKSCALSWVRVPRRS